MVRVAIIGAGDLGQQIARMIDQYSADTIAGYFDDFYDGTDPQRILLGKLDELAANDDRFDVVIIGIGYKHLAFKRRIAGQIKSLAIPLYRFIHPTAIIDQSARIGGGVVIYPGVIIDMESSIEDHCILNNGSIVSHDSRVGACSFLAPGVVVSGNCTIGKQNFLGSGTVFSDGISSGESVQTGAGSVVVSNLPENGLYLGVPAKLQKDG